MKTTISVALLLMCAGVNNVHAGLYYDNTQTASSDTMKIGGLLRITDPAAPYTPTITLTGAGGAVAAASLSADTGTINSTFTVKGNAFSVGASSFTVSGGSATVASSLSANSLAATLGVTGATANLGTSVTTPLLSNVANYSNAVGAVTFSNTTGGAGFSFRPGGGTVHALDIDGTTFNATVAGGVTASSFTTASSVTASAFFGSGAALTNVNVAAANVSAGSLGSSVIASSVGVSGVTAGTYGSGTSVAQIAVAGDGRITSASNVSIGTLGVPAGGTGDTSLTAHGLVIGEGTSNLASIPAMGVGGLVVGAGTGVDPSTVAISAALKYFGGASGGVFGVDSASVTVKSSGLIRNSELDSSSVTLQGNAFNGNSQLIQTAADGKYPALNGSLITNIGGVLSGLTAGKAVYASNSTTLAAGPTNVTSSSVTYPTGTTLYLAAGSAFNVDTTVSTGQEIWVGSATVSNVAFATITLTGYAVDPSSISWRAKFNCNNAGAARYGFIFNGNNAAVYNSQADNGNTTSTLTGSGGAADNYADAQANSTVANSVGIILQIWFETAVGGSNGAVAYEGVGSVQISASTRRTTKFSGLFSGGATTLSSLGLGMSSTNSSNGMKLDSNFTCHWDLWRQGYVRGL
jgi:hypothetical protein